MVHTEEEEKTMLPEGQEASLSYQVETIQDVFCEHSTAPIWDHSSQTFYFIDVSGNAVHRYQPETKFHDVLRIHRDKKVAFVALTEDSDVLLVGCGNSVFKVFIEKDNRMRLDYESTIGMDITVDMSRYRFVLGKCSPYGELFFTAESKSISAKHSENLLFRMVAPKEKANSTHQQYLLQEVIHEEKAPGCPTGLCWDHGGRSLYVTDGDAKRLLRYVSVPFRSTLENREDVIDFASIADGVPSGVAVDKKGYVWVAIDGAGEIICIDPSKGFGKGVVVHRVKMPVRNVTSCTFGGPNLEHLYVTSNRPVSTAKKAAIEGSLFRIALPGSSFVMSSNPLCVNIISFFYRCSRKCGCL